MADGYQLSAFEVFSPAELLQASLEQLADGIDPCDSLLAAAVPAFDQAWRLGSGMRAHGHELIIIQ